MKNLRFILSIAILGNITAIAQQRNAQIIGTIQSDSGAPVPYTTVMLLDKDSTYIVGAISNDKGEFTLSANPATYQVKVQNLEFETYVSDFFVLNNGEKKSLGSIRMKPSVTMLGDVVIAGKKELVEVHPDKMVFNVSTSVNASGNSGLELLSKAPGVLIDPDNNIILQGKAGVRIYINGRPSRLSGTDLVTMLQSMQSDNIESIEIITNPSAKYEAEGNAGIINIILKKNPDQGTNGTIVSNISKGDFWRSNHGLSLNHRAEKINVYADVTRFDNDFQSDFIDVKLQNGYSLAQASYGVNHGDGYNFSAGIDYTFNSKHSLALFGRGIANKGSSDVNSITGIEDLQGGSPTEILVARSLQGGTSNNYNYNLNYIFNISSTANFTADASFGHFVNDANTAQPNTYYAEDGTTVNSEVNSEFATSTDIDLWSMKADYEKRFKKVVLSAGGKHSYVNTANSFKFYNVESGTPVLDIDRSNDFTYEERVTGLYLILNSNLGDKFKLNTGIRMEHTNSRGRLLTETAINDKDVQRNYTNFFPNVGISYSNKKSVEMNASIGRRITRPNYQDLNPFEFKLSELAYFKGNPFLKPNYIMNYQFTFSYKHKLVISNVYSVTSNYFANILVVTGDKATFLSPRNMDRITNNGLSISYPITLAKWWDASSFLNYTYSTYEGNIEGTLIDITINTYNFRIQNNFSLPADITIDLTYFYNSPFVWRGSIEIDATSGVNFGIKKDLLKKNLQIRATASDLFNKYSDYYYHGDYGGLLINGRHGVDNQRYGVGLTYKFGNQRVKASKKKSALEDELNRISN